MQFHTILLLVYIEFFLTRICGLDVAIAKVLLFYKSLVAKYVMLSILCDKHEDGYILSYLVLCCQIPKLFQTVYL